MTQDARERATAHEHIGALERDARIRICACGAIQHRDDWYEDADEAAGWEILYREAIRQRDAAKREDEQRIAALVAAAQEAHAFATPTWSADHHLIHPCLVCTGETSHVVGCWVENLGRALAGSEESGD